MALRLGQTLRDVLSAHPEVVTAWVFGSVAAGTARPDSDLDLAVIVRGAEGDRDALLLLSGELERCSPSGRVDLVLVGTPENEPGPILRHRILRDGVLVKDDDPERRIDFEGRTTSEYLDWKPTHDIAMRSTLQGLRDRFTPQGHE